MRELAISLLGFLTFAIAYCWIFTFLFMGRFLERFSWYRNLPDRRQSAVSGWIVIAGIPVLWLTWAYLLPEWWKDATPLIASDP